MAEQKTKGKKPPTARQLEIKRLVDKGSDRRSDQESARLDQLKQEERRDRFQRLAVRRVQNALKALRNVARMGNRQTYQYSDEEASKICTVLEVACDEVGKAFYETKRQGELFTL